MIFETHAHYDDEKFDEDRAELLSSMQENGIGRIINVSANLESLENTRKLMEAYPFIYGAFGLHPDEVGDLNEDVMARMRELCRMEKAVAVGEIGLDYYWDKENHEKQEYEELSLSRTAEHTRAFIKVQDGCNQFCTYCIIPFARGRVRSRELPDVLQEIRTLAKSGYREVVLTGIHLSSYGVDNGESLLHLIEAVHELEGIERIRLGSLEPRIVTDAFAKRLSELPKICPHFHLSLQSGCDTVLSRMNRRYDTAEYEVGCALLRRYFEHPAITTDVIVGFPGETDEEFETTERYLERIHFYEMHIFQYSRREGTKAAAMPDQVPEAVKKERSEKLLALGHRMSGEFRRYYLGRQVTALLEEEFLYDGKRYYTGYTKEYVKVAVETKKDLSNTFVTGTLKTQLTEDVYLLVEF